MSIYKGCFTFKRLFPLFPVAFIFILSANSCFISQKRGGQTDADVIDVTDANASSDRSTVARDRDVDTAEGDNERTANRQKPEANGAFNALRDDPTENGNRDSGVDGAVSTTENGMTTGGETPFRPIVSGGPCTNGTYLDLVEFPIDIIIAVETTSGMSDEVADLQKHLNSRLFERLRALHIDPSIIVIAAQTGNPLSSQHICLDAPLGSGSCPDDSNPPDYYHIDIVVDHNDALNGLADYLIYQRFLRPNARKVFLAISDGDATAAPYDSADAFIRAIERQANVFRDWMFYSIHCFEQCDEADAIGRVYNDLVAKTSGEAFDLCLQDFSSVFEELATDIVYRDAFGCSWTILPVVDGDPPRPDFVNLVYRDKLDREQYIGMVPSEKSCESLDAWFYQSESDPMMIGLCPVACRRFREGDYAVLELLFGCSGVFVDYETPK